jgi:PTS system mannose-specific IID component
MTGLVRAYFRLLAVQGAWSYERMNGIGLGYAAQPLLEDLKLSDPARHAEASVRSSEYFNSHPYLAGLALGALVRAEYDHLPGPQISRLRAALCSPLGALGDQLFWIGLVPALMGGVLIAAVFGRGLPALIVALVLYNVIRLITGGWALRRGLATGIRVAGALETSWLKRSITPVGLAAGLLVGLALPVVGHWLLTPAHRIEMAVGLAVMLLTLVGSWRLGSRLPFVPFAFAALLAAALYSWVGR